MMTDVARTEMHCVVHERHCTCKTQSFHLSRKPITVKISAVFNHFLNFAFSKAINMELSLVFV